MTHIRDVKYHGAKNVVGSCFTAEILGWVHRSQTMERKVEWRNWKELFYYWAWQEETCQEISCRGTSWPGLTCWSHTRPQPTCRPPRCRSSPSYKQTGPWHRPPEGLKPFRYKSKLAPRNPGEHTETSGFGAMVKWSFIFKCSNLVFLHHSSSNITLH